MVDAVGQVALPHAVDLAAVFVGILACTCGGVIRDLLLRTEVALVTVGSFYAFAAFGGALVYMGLQQYTNANTAAWAAVAVTFAVRMLSVWFGWSTPHASALALTASVARAEQLARTTVQVITRRGFMTPAQTAATPEGQPPRESGGSG
jgi:hypothetical protein